MPSPSASWSSGWRAEGVKQPMETISLRIPVPLRERVRARALEQGRDQSELIREAVEAFLGHSDPTVQDRLQAVERRLGAIEARLPE